MNTFSKFVLASTIFFSPVTQAILIDNGFFTTDTESGLEWLDVNFDLSPEEATYGWRYATTMDWQDFWSRNTSGDHYSPLISFPDPHPYYGKEVIQYGPEDTDITQILSMLGSNTGQSIAGFDTTVLDSHDNTVIRGVFANLSGNADLYPFLPYVPTVGISWDHVVNPLDPFDLYGPSNPITAGVQSIMLVRVPEPSIITLICAGLLGLGFVRRRRLES